MKSDPLFDAKLLRVIKEQCEQDFTFFVRYFFKRVKGSKFVFSEHHFVICEHLKRIHAGLQPFTIFNTPPRYSKTELIIILFSAWCYMRNRRCEFIHLSYSEPLVLENSDRIRSILKCAEFQAMWPGLSILPNKDSKGAWGTNEGGAFLAAPSAGSVTGFGAGRLDEIKDDGSFVFSGAILIDDPLKPDDANSEPKRNAINGRWDSTIKSRRNSSRTPVIVCMQRIHEMDFTGMLLEDSEFEWVVVKIPALIDEDEPTMRALWPVKHDVDALLAMRAKNKHVFSAQYQQSPKPLGGNLFKGANFGRYTVVPPLRYRLIFGDTAQKTGERNDYSVFQCWGYGTDNRIYLLDQIRGKWEASDLKQKAKDFWAKHHSRNVRNAGGNLRKMYVEDKSSGTGLIQDIKKEGRIPIEGIPRDRDKLSRALDGIPYVDSGYVMIPAEADYISEFIHECEAFTADDTHAYDDQIDPMLDAISEMLGNGRPMVISDEALRQA